jgi:soluble lytic murein transglycosylase-like protein
MFSRTIVILAFVLSLLASAPGFGQTLYSYVDENGIRILTNIPPKNVAKDLQVTGPPPAPPKPAPSKGGVSFDPIIEKYSAEYRMDPSLVRAMISKESGFNSKAVSPKGAQGLMQLMPATAARHGVRNTFDPEENIKGGIKHMRSLMDMFDNNLTLSLAAYNAGENLVQRIGRVPNIRETNDYVRTITQKYGKSKMETVAEQPVQPSMYRFTDQNGILHLTNIPPVRREEAPASGWAAANESR